MILVTGGDGFIGRHLLNKINGDIYDRKVINNVKLDDNKYNIIYHLAASTFLVEGYSKQIIEDNIILSQEIKNLNKRTIYASSAAVYNLNNLYAFSKKFNEDLFENSNAVGLRFYNVYGPNDNGVVGKLIKCAISGEPFNLHQGHFTRDFIYVDDVIDSIIQNTDSKKKIIEIGTGISTSIQSLIDMVEQLIGKKVIINKIKPNMFEQEYSVCPDPLNKFTSLEDGLISTIKSYINL